MPQEFSEEDIYVEVALPVAQFMTFTYRIPSSLYSSLENKDLIGRRVLVPFKKKGFTGIILEISKNWKELKNIRDIIEIPDKKPVFTEEYVQLIKRISDYYVSPVGMVAYYLIPEGLRWEYNREKGKWIHKKAENFVYIPDVLTVSDLPKLSKKAKELLQFILEKGEITEEEIKDYGFSKQTLNSLIEKKVVKRLTLHLRNEVNIKQTEKLFNKRKTKRDFYLYSSDKINIRLNRYIRWISQAIKEGKNSIITFPNIASLKKAYETLKPYYGDKIFIYFDGLSEKEKVKTWFSLMEYSGFILLGTYPSVFIPVKNLAFLIVEEEHSDSYKILRTPRFDLRRVSYELFKIRNSFSLIFSSSVPSVESFYSVEKGIMKRLSKKNILPKKGADIEIQKLNRENPLNDEIKRLILNKDKTVLILGNRKGYASFLYCDRCEEEIFCERCDIPLKIHKEKEKYLKCETCGKKYLYTDKCIRCNSKLKEIGLGTEKILEEVLNIVPDNVSFIDEPVNSRIKIGTSIIDKEILVDEFDYVINIYPDFFLFIPDFKGEEKFFRNIIYPYLKAREKYILITNSAENIAVKSLVSKDLNIFYKNELINRKSLEYPPFSKIVLLTFEKRKISTEEVDKIFKDWIKKNRLKNIEYEGVFYAYHTKIRDRLRVQITLKNFKEREKLKNLYEKASEKGIKLIIDVDPKQIL
ncbi:primosomal protein N' family DNA-binding protein [Persephonella sp.]